MRTSNRTTVKIDGIKILFPRKNSVCWWICEWLSMGVFYGVSWKEGRETPIEKPPIFSRPLFQPNPMVFHSYIYTTPRAQEKSPHPQHRAQVHSGPSEC
jgi:hypothetical protein